MDTIQNPLRTNNILMEPNVSKWNEMKFAEINELIPAALRIRKKLYPLGLGLATGPHTSHTVANVVLNQMTESAIKWQMPRKHK